MIDALIDKVIFAETREELIVASRALDRVLLSGHYVSPLFHQKSQWIARWKQLAHPDKTSLYGYRVDTWWIDRPGG